MLLQAEPLILLSWSWNQHQLATDVMTTIVVFRSSCWLCGGQSHCRVVGGKFAGSVNEKIQQRFNLNLSGGSFVDWVDVRAVSYIIHSFTAAGMTWGIIFCICRENCYGACFCLQRPIKAIMRELSKRTTGQRDSEVHQLMFPRLATRRPLIRYKS